MAKPKMLTCIARPKNTGESVSQRAGDLDSEKTPNSKQLAIKTLTSQIKGMAVKASGAYKCNPCAHPTPSQPKKAAGEPVVVDGEGSERFRWSGSYRRTTSTNSASRWGKEMEARLKVLSTASSREGSARSPYGSGAASAAASGRRTDSPAAAVVVVEEETEPKEWVAQVEPGVLITFVSLPRGGNDLKRIRFSRDTFDQMQAQRWWTDNYEKVMELYNVQRLNRQGVPFPTDPPRPEERISKKESTKIGPVTPPLTPEILPRNLHHGEGTDDYLSSDSYNDIQRQKRQQSKQIHESSGLASTPKYSNISSATKLETSSMDDQSLMSSSSTDADHLSGQLSFSNASDLESEWVEEDEPGVYITIRALPGGRRELRRVRFSRERFAEMNARLWWEENRARIHEQYL